MLTLPHLFYSEVIDSLLVDWVTCVCSGKHEIHLISARICRNSKYYDDETYIYIVPYDENNVESVFMESVAWFEWIRKKWEESL